MVAFIESLYSKYSSLRHVVSSRLVMVVLVMLQMHVIIQSVAKTKDGEDGKEHRGRTGIGPIEKPTFDACDTRHGSTAFWKFRVEFDERTE